MQLNSAGLRSLGRLIFNGESANESSNSTWKLYIGIDEVDEVAQTPELKISMYKNEELAPITQPIKDNPLITRKGRADII